MSFYPNIYSSWIIPQKNNLVLKIYDLDDGETDDDDRDRLGFSCPFCQELFDETDLAKEHVIKHHSDEENRSVADDEDEDLYSCPFFALDFDNYRCKISQITHVDEDFYLRACYLRK